jgi:CO/xanthine dehydrogenase FAD-binding subunit
LDLNTITETVTRPGLSALSEWRDGDAWLGGGTYLFSEPQPALRRLIDLDGFGWTPIELKGDVLSVASTAKIADLFAWKCAPEWTAAHLISDCCNALLGSFKIWNMATVGGNICLSLPAGPMTSLASALGASCLIWMPGGGERRVPAAEFVTGNRRNVLARGELLRAIDIPVESLKSRAAFRQVSLTPLGRSAALLIGMRAPNGRTAITVTASTVRPVRMEFPRCPGIGELQDAIAQAIPASLYHDDIHGHPEWRRHLTLNLAEEIRRELAPEAA